MPLEPSRITQEVRNARLWLGSARSWLGNLDSNRHASNAHATGISDGLTCGCEPPMGSRRTDVWADRSVDLHKWRRGRLRRRRARTTCRAATWGIDGDAVSCGDRALSPDGGRSRAAAVSRCSSVRRCSKNSARECLPSRQDPSLTTCTDLGASAPCRRGMIRMVRWGPFARAAREGGATGAPTPVAPDHPTDPWVIKESLHDG